MRAVLQEAARIVPLEFILIETDAPYLRRFRKEGRPMSLALLFIRERSLPDLKGLRERTICGNSIRKISMPFFRPLAPQIG